MSVEVRRVVIGECDCGTPRFSWEHGTDHRHYWECDYGEIPSFDMENPAPLIIVRRDWVHDVLAKGGRVAQGGQRRIGEKLFTVTVDAIPDETGEITENSGVRIFHRLDCRGRSWIWELEPAHWADPATRYNNARMAIYLGRWRD